MGNIYIKSLLAALCFHAYQQVSLLFVIVLLISEVMPHISPCVCILCLYLSGYSLLLDCFFQFEHYQSNPFC